MITYIYFVYSKIHAEQEKAPLPVRRDRLRESQESNKENDERCDSLGDKHLEELVSEGFERASAIRALSISHNNIQLARDILREFVPRK